MQKQTFKVYPHASFTFIGHVHNIETYEKNRFSKHDYNNLNLTYLLRQKNVCMHVMQQQNNNNTKLTCSFCGTSAQTPVISKPGGIIAYYFRNVKPNYKANEMSF